MSLLEKALFGASLVIYLFAAERQIRALFRRQEALDKTTFGPLTAGLILHLGAFAARAFTTQPHRLPLTGVPETFSFLAWLLILSWMILELRWRIAALGALALPLAAVLDFLGLVGMAKAGRLYLLENPLVGAHITLSLLGYAAFALAFCAAVTYLLQDRLLKTKRLTGLSRHLPPVLLSDETSYRLVAVGFPVFSLGLILGAVWAYLRGESYPTGDPKEIWGLITWVIFAVYLYARALQGWRGRRTAALLVIGFISILITYLAVGHTLAT